MQYMAVEKAKKCPVCHGYGKTSDGKRCQRCDGKGEVPVHVIRHSDRVPQEGHAP
jgi:DnaJ-class molecular chaperone